MGTRLQVCAAAWAIIISNIDFILLIGVRIREDTLLEDNAPLPENFTKTQKR